MIKSAASNETLTSWRQIVCHRCNQSHSLGRSRGPSALASIQRWGNTIRARTDSAACWSRQTTQGCGLRTVTALTCNVSSPCAATTGSSRTCTIHTSPWPNGRHSGAITWTERAWPVSLGRSKLSACETSDCPQLSQLNRISEHFIGLQPDNDCRKPQKHEKRSDFQHDGLLSIVKNCFFWRSNGLRRRKTHGFCELSDLKVALKVIRRLGTCLTATIPSVGVKRNIEPFANSNSVEVGFFFS